MTLPNPQQPISLTREELRELVVEVTTETLLRLGVDVEDPLEMQHDFQHLRDWRTSIDSIKKKGVLAIVTTVTLGLLGLLWLGVKNMLASP